MSVCVGTQCVPGVAACVVAKIYSIQTHFLINTRGARPGPLPGGFRDMYKKYYKDSNNHSATASGPAPPGAPARAVHGGRCHRRFVHMMRTNCSSRAQREPPPLRSLPHSRAASSPGPGCTAHVEYAASLPRPLVEAFKCAVRHVRATVRGAFFFGGA